MESIQQSYNPAYIQSERRESLVTQFILWCTSQEKFRLGWLGIIIGSLGCIITPVTLFAIILSDNSVLSWAFASAALGISLIPNLAALSTKITIPVFLFSVIVDLVIITNCITIGFDISRTYI